LTPRAKDSQKGDFGHVLVIGGHEGMGGAALLAGESAARVGAGLVSIALHPEYVAAITSARPELMCHGIKNSNDIVPLLQKATVIVLGAGLGQDAWSQALYSQALNSPQPMVIDADALNLLAKQQRFPLNSRDEGSSGGRTAILPSDSKQHYVLRSDYYQEEVHGDFRRELLAKQPQQRNNWILTPHPGEAGRLLNCSVQEIQSDRFRAAAELQKKYGGVIVLKGAGTIIQAEDHIPALCTAGNPGMATGGMGDVLGGVIGGLLAQKLSLVNAAKLGVLLHAMAGDRAAQNGGQRGLLASDLLPILRELINNNPS